MNKKLLECLEDLERRIDPEVEEDLTKQWLDFVEGKCSSNVFVPKRKKASKPGVEWPKVFANDTLDNDDLLLLQQYEMCSKQLEKGGGELLSIRANFGTGIIPSLFGAEKFIMPYDTDTLPSVKPLAGGIEDIRKIVEKGIPDLYQENTLGEKSLDITKKFVEVGEQYKNIGKYVHVYHPDTQGPLAIADILWGSDIYIDVFDEPDLVHAMIDLATETYIKYTHEWYKIVKPFSSEYSVHWGMLMKGHVLIRDDACMNISPAMVKELAMQYDQRIFDQFNGGGIHFCGKGDHYVNLISELKGISCINMSEPELNDMSKIYGNTVEKGINIIGLKKEEIDRVTSEKIDVKGRVHCGASIAAWIKEE